MKIAIPPSRLWLFGMFALPIGTASTLAWTAQREAVALGASAVALRSERARLQSELASLDQRRRELQRGLADAQTKRAVAEAALTPELRRRQAVLAVLATLREKSPGGASASGPRRPQPPSGSHGNVYFPELFVDPHYAQVYLTATRQRIAERYAPLFAQVQLPPDQVDRLKEMLLQKGMAYEEMDGIMENEAMQEKKPMDRSAALPIKMRVNRTFEEEIKQAFGEVVFGQWREFENGIGARQALLDKLALRLSYSAAPLEEAQAAQLVRVFNRTRSAGIAGGGPPRGVSDAFVAEAQSILKPEQMSALWQLQAELAATWVGSSVQVRSGSPPVAVPPRPPGGR